MRISLDTTVWLALSVAACGSPAPESVNWASRPSRNSALTPQGVFTELFTWRGNHASTLHTGENAMGEPGHTGSTVWWNEDAWDVRGDTGYLATSYQQSYNVKGYHIDVHKAANDDPRDASQDNALAVPGGDGSPGVAAMRADYQGISSARLRNPLLVRADEPAVVEFYAPLFVTTGHWWEVAFTPTDVVTAGVNTSVPQQVGRTPFEDSLNFVAIGASDVPCRAGWKVALELHRTYEGSDVVRAVPSSRQPVGNPDEKMVLTRWRLELRPDGVELYADIDDDGEAEHLHSYPVSVPWPEVHVQLLAVAYQGDHHPQGACHQGVSREFVWRHVTAYPVKFAGTSIAPRNTSTDNVQRRTGWMSYDTRDIQRFGPAEHGMAQANARRYDRYGYAAFASMNLTSFGAPAPVTAKILHVELTEAQARAEMAQLVYETKGGNAQSSVTLHINGQPVSGYLPLQASVRHFGTGVNHEWTERSFALPAAARELLRPGDNTVQFQLSSGLAFDRVHLEFGHQSAGEDDGHEPDDEDEESLPHDDGDSAGEALSCAGHCGSRQPVYGEDTQCRCDRRCRVRRDCCADYRQECAAP